jgi:UDP-MurNAc hydroxylase
MKLKLFRSSTVGINIDNFKILQDPWLTDGEYYGSWSHYPPYDLNLNLEEINSYNAIYISHIHPDHCSEDTLKFINKNIPIYIHSYHAKFLKLKIERLGFKVNELQNGIKYPLAKNLFLNIFAADNCNPELCYKFTGCAQLDGKNNGSQQIDTLAIINDNNNTLVNINDCPFELANSTFEKIKRQYKKIDILLTGYGGAGPYPQCFENLSLKEKKVAAKKKQIQFLNQAISYIEELKPAYYLPFAGTYTLAGKLSSLQNLRGVPTIDEAHNFFDNYFNVHKSIVNPKLIKMNYESVFDLNTKQCSKAYKKIDLDEYYNYIKNNLENKKLMYEKFSLPSFEEIYDLSKGAFVNFLNKKIISKINLKSDIFIKVNEKSLKLSTDNKLQIVNTCDIKKFSRYVTYQTDLRLLKFLLMGPKYAHWNNAEIGSHIKFYRKPDVFERELYYSMSYFHN